MKVYYNLIEFPKKIVRDWLCHKSIQLIDKNPRSFCNRNERLNSVLRSIKSVIVRLKPPNFARKRIFLSY